jgi:hypothetical protein
MVQDLRIDKYEPLFTTLAYQVGKSTLQDIEDLKQEYRYLFYYLKGKVIVKGIPIQNFDWYFKQALRNRNADIIKSRQKQTRDTAEYFSFSQRSNRLIDLPKSINFPENTLFQKMLTLVQTGDVQWVMENKIERKGRTALQQYTEAFKCLGFKESQIGNFLLEFLGEHMDNQCFLCKEKVDKLSSIFMIEGKVYCKNCILSVKDVKRRLTFFQQLDPQRQTLDKGSETFLNKVIEKENEGVTIISTKTALKLLGWKVQEKPNLYNAINNHPEIFQKSKKIGNKYALIEKEVFNFKTFLAYKKEHAGTITDKSHSLIENKEWLTLSEAVEFTGLKPHKIIALYKQQKLVTEELPPHTKRKYSKKALQNYRKQTTVTCSLLQLQMMASFIDGEKFKKETEGKTPGEIARTWDFPLEFVKLVTAFIYKEKPEHKKVMVTDIGLATETEEHFVTLPFKEAFFMLHKLLLPEYLPIWKEYFFDKFYTEDLDEVLQGLSFRKFEDKEDIISFLVEKLEYSDLATAVVKIHLVNMLYTGRFSL